jgi:SPFH domain / Band 7 family
MSHEWHGSDPQWQSPDENGWHDRADEGEQEFSPPPRDHLAATSPPAQYSGGAFEEEDQAPAGKFDALRRLGQQLSPILVPLLLAALTLLFTLPLLLTNRVYLQSESLWPFALVLLAVAILQGTTLYYLGSNNSFWWLSIIGGFLLFLLIACFAIFGPVSTAIFLVVVVIVGLISARLYARPVPAGTVDIIYAFGKYSRTFYPGFNLLLPWEVVDSHLQTREKQWTTPEQIVQVTRDNDVHLKAVISYQLMPEDAYLAMTQVENWEQSLRNLFIACLQQASSDLTLDDFMAWPQRSQQAVGLRPHEGNDDENARWARVNNLLFQRMRDHVANWGVCINWVYIRDISLTPHSAGAYDPGQTFQATLPAAGAPTHFQQTPGRAGPTMPPVRQNVAGGTPMAAPAPGAATLGTAPPAAVAAPAATATTATVAKSAREEALIKAYKQIQNDKIKSPATIRDIAGKFLAIANDPEASKNASFDASRAAQALYDRADLYDKQAATMGEVFEDDTPTQADWPSSYSHHSDEDNYMGG